MASLSALTRSTFGELVELAVAMVEEPQPDFVARLVPSANVDEEIWEELLTTLDAYGIPRLALGRIKVNLFNKRHTLFMGFEGARDRVTNVYDEEKVKVLFEALLGSQFAAIAAADVVADAIVSFVRGVRNDVAASKVDFATELAERRAAQDAQPIRPDQTANFLNHTARYAIERAKWIARFERDGWPDIGDERARLDMVMHALLTPLVLSPDHLTIHSECSGCMRAQRTEDLDRIKKLQKPLTTGNFDVGDVDEDEIQLEVTDADAGHLFDVTSNPKGQRTGHARSAKHGIADLEAARKLAGTMAAKYAITRDPKDNPKLLLFGYNNNAKWLSATDLSVRTATIAALDKILEAKAEGSILESE
eukprot:Amastigsp_a841972_24.p1 type:complete len:364 gc:universal Amastigsp_a841972_24:395-1486(+)